MNSSLISIPLATFKLFRFPPAGIRIWKVNPLGGGGHCRRQSPGMTLPPPQMQLSPCPPTYSFGICGFGEIPGASLAPGKCHFSRIMLRVTRSVGRIQIFHCPLRRTVYRPLEKIQFYLPGTFLTMYLSPLAFSSASLPLYMAFIIVLYTRDISVMNSLLEYSRDGPAGLNFLCTYGYCRAKWQQYTLQGLTNQLHFQLQVSNCTFECTV